MPLAAVAEGCAALAIGAALFVTGMLGLAETYEKQSHRLAALLASRQIPDLAASEASDQTAGNASEAPIDGAAGLAHSDEHFWRDYLNTASGLIIALGGLLALVLVLGDIPYESYSMTVGAGIAGIALPTLLLWGRGLLRIRRSHVRVASSARRVDALPEPTVEQKIEAPRRPTRGAVFGSESSPRPLWGGISPESQVVDCSLLARGLDTDAGPLSPLSICSRYC